MKNFSSVKIRPNAEEIKNFQNEVFEKFKIGIVCPHDIPELRSRFHRESIYDSRISYNHTIRVVQFIRAHENIATALRMQIQNPCLSTLHFEGYHIGNYGIVFNKENGDVVCLVNEPNFKLIITNKHELAIQKGDKQLRIYSVYNAQKLITEYVVSEHQTMELKEEKEVIQNREVSGIKNVKSSEASWINSAMQMYFEDYEGTLKKMTITQKKVIV